MNKMMKGKTMKVMWCKYLKMYYSDVKKYTFNRNLLIKLATLKILNFIN